MDIERAPSCIQSLEASWGLGHEVVAVRPKTAERIVEEYLVTAEALEEQSEFVQELRREVEGQIGGEWYICPVALEPQARAECTPRCSHLVPHREKMDCGIEDMRFCGAVCDSVECKPLAEILERSEEDVEKMVGLLDRERCNVFERDGGQCIYPGCTKQAADIAHILPKGRFPEERDTPWNLCCLCRAHHNATETALGRTLLMLRMNELYGYGELYREEPYAGYWRPEAPRAYAEYPPEDEGIDWRIYRE